jgi:hypothetical protein
MEGEKEVEDLSLLIYMVQARTTSLCDYGGLRSSSPYTSFSFSTSLSLRSYLFCLHRCGHELSRSAGLRRRDVVGPARATATSLAVRCVAVGERQTYVTPLRQVRITFGGGGRNEGKCGIRGSAHFIWGGGGESRIRGGGNDWEIYEKAKNN